MKRQKTVWMLVSALALTMAGVLGARADEPAPPPPTLTISGAGTKVPISHAMRFQAALTAVVADAPKSTDEATITGPKWQWSGGNGSVQFISTTDNPATLDSGDPPVYPGTQTTPLFVVPVSCTATYISTNKKTGAETPITASNDDAVQFVVLWPTRVKELGHRQNVTDLGLSPYRSVEDPNHYPVSYWGSSTAYDLEVQDNQASHQPYPYGVVEEGFANVQVMTRHPDLYTVGDQPNGGGAPARWAAPDFTDIMTLVFYNRVPMLPTGEYDMFEWNEDERKYGLIPEDEMQREFDQTWTHLEPPAAPVGLGSHHIRNNFLNTVRTGG